MTLKTGVEAKKSLIKGANIVADAVKVTMGAEGKLAIIRNKMGFAPHVTKDGVTVAEAVELEDDFEELGAKAIKETARKTVDLVGDGTTTATVIALLLKTFCQAATAFISIPLGPPVWPMLCRYHCFPNRGSLGRDISTELLLEAAGATLAAPVSEL